MNAARPATDRPDGYVPTLDGWRAVAILLVLACHASGSALAQRGGVGVDIFFGLSGFLIGSRLFAEQRRNGSISLRGFYARRAFRILPQYATYLIVIGLLGAFGVVRLYRSEWAACALFVRNYLPKDLVGGDFENAWYTGHFWSLAVEEHFYLIAPVLLAFLGPARLGKYLVPAAVALIAWRGLDARLHLFDRVLPGVDPNLRTDLRFDGLLWGWALACRLDHEPTRERWRRLVRPPVWFAFALIFAAVVLKRPPMYRTFTAMLVPLLLAGTVLHPRSWAARVLEWGPLRAIGRLSYALYVWQQLFMIHAEHQRSSALHALQVLPWNLVAAAVCAGLSRYAVELPCLELGRRILARRAGANGVAPPLGGTPRRLPVPVRLW